VGATGVFVAAAAVGANQTRHQAASVTNPAIETVVPARTPNARPKPQVVVSTPTANPAADNSTPPPAPRPRQPANVRPERSLAGTIKDVQPDSIDVVGLGGREWRVEPAPGALIRLNGRAARLDSLQAGDGVVILGQAEPGPGLRFLAHAITARAK
jgi:hypothetical protein